MYDLLIKNAVIITADPSHHIYDKGYIAAKDGRIAAIGPLRCV